MGCCDHFTPDRVWKTFPKGSYVVIKSAPSQLFKVVERDGWNRMLRVEGPCSLLVAGYEDASIWTHVCVARPMCNWLEAEVVV